MRGLKATSAGSLNPQLQPVMNRKHPRLVASGNGLPVSRGFNLDDRVVQVRHGFSCTAMVMCCLL